MTFRNEDLPNTDQELIVPMPDILDAHEANLAIREFTLKSQTFKVNNGLEPNITIAKGDKFTRSSAKGSTRWEVQGLGSELGAVDLGGTGTAWYVLAQCIEGGIHSEYIDGDIVAVPVKTGEQIIFYAGSVLNMLDTNKPTKQT